MSDFLTRLRTRFPGASVLGLPFSEGQRARVEWTVGPYMFVDVDFNGDWTIELVPVTGATLTVVGVSLESALGRLDQALQSAELVRKLLGVAP